jgi:hypothetical protein
MHNLWRNKDDEKKTDVDEAGFNGRISIGCMLCWLYQKGGYQE